LFFSAFLCYKSNVKLLLLDVELATSPAEAATAVWQQQQQQQLYNSCQQQQQQLLHAPQHQGENQGKITFLAEEN
jgi:hypothetical protein